MTVGCKNPCDDIERLCVCGTCVHMVVEYDYFVCELGDRVSNVGDPIHWHDPCHFTPSEWRPYWEES